MSRKLYLAYGSNLNVRQMMARCPDAILIGKTVLEGYRITFRGNAWTGVANIEPRAGSTVPVGIWSITDEDEKNLDVYEGYPHLYYKQGFIIDLGGRSLPAMAYIMTPGRKWRKPSPTYLNTIMQGYKDFGFSITNLRYAAKTPTKELTA